MKKPLKQLRKKLREGQMLKQTWRAAKWKTKSLKLTTRARPTDLLRKATSLEDLRKEHR
jgi:hypothetical protein